jgi:hypothetical protein
VCLLLSINKKWILTHYGFMLLLSFSWTLLGFIKPKVDPNFSLSFRLYDSYSLLRKPALRFSLRKKKKSIRSFTKQTIENWKPNENARIQNIVKSFGRNNFLSNESMRPPVDLILYYLGGMYHLLFKLEWQAPSSEPSSHNWKKK